MRKVAAATLVLTLTACGDAPGPTVCGAARVDMDVSTGESAVVLEPDDTTGALVMYHHGIGERADAIVTDERKLDLVCALLADGYLVAGADAADENWGNDAALAAYRGLYDVVDARYGVTDVMVLSQEMGGLSGLNSIAEHTIPNVRAWVGIDPVTNLGHSSTQPRFHDAIADAYPSDDLAAHDPVLRKASAYDIPMLAWASSDDPVAPKAEHLDRLAALVPVDVIETVGERGDESNFDPARVVEFFDAYRTP